MRKKINILLALMLVLSFAVGCGSKTNTAKKEKIDDTPNKIEDSADSVDDDALATTLPIIDDDFLEKEANLDNKIDLSTTKPTDCVLRFGSNIYSLPFSYGRISKRWTFNLADYDLDDSFMLEPGQRTSDTIILTNEKTDYQMIVGFYNPYDVPISINDSKIWSLSISIEGVSKKPFIRLPQDLSWKSRFVDVIKSYSDLTSQFTHDTEAGMYHYTFKKDYERYLLLDISEEKGIVAFTMKCYK